jgi:hypothetical protein
VTLLVRLGLVVAFYGAVYGLITFGGDQVADVLESRFLIGLVGLVAGFALFGLYLWAETLFASASNNRTPSESEGVEEATPPMGPVGIVALLSVAVILALASFGYSGTPMAFSAGLLIGTLIAMVAAPRLGKLGLQS